MSTEADDFQPVSIQAGIAAKLNFACHQSAFPFLRELRIDNGSEHTRLDDVLITLSSNPAFLKPKSWRLDRIAPASSISVGNRDIELDGGFLLDLADSVRGTVSIAAEIDGETVAQQNFPVELLAYNEWGGAGYMPELLAAFSMPNDPAIDHILRQASLMLRKAGKSDTIDGYEKRSRQRVWEIASAIYTAIANLGITYALPPASFERDGQKIRLPSQVLENRVATCLDSTMLFASALEQAGLNPIIALPQQHAVVGVWLQPEELSTVVIEEAETLRKRIQPNELILIETTFVTSHPAPPFSRAVAAAAETVSPDKDSTFHAAVDIRRARAHRITPLGLKAEPPRAPNETSEQLVELSLEEAPALPDFDDGVEQEAVPETPTGRLERWHRKLLDLSARNPLLNHRSTKTSLQILCPDPGLLEDKLAEGARISINAVPQATSQAQDEELHRQRTGEIISDEYARNALDRKEVLVALPAEELGRRAVDVYRKAQTALQEGGANTLYLALGFLLWKKDEKDERRFRAPLILLPVTLERKSVRSGIKMLAHDDEPRFNTTLLEMLRRDFQIDIRGLDRELPQDHSGIDVSGIWNTVRKAVKEVPGFEVIEDVVLGHFSFAKYLMWKDLVDRTDALRENAIVRHLIDNPRDPYPSDISFVDSNQVDLHFKPSDLLAPLPADASQMAAIATADRGKDFVIIGPPGTGKSQTISNLIAHMLGKGKTVLFVSEKTAALEVVYRRLNEIGLGRFCLELHSNKTRKADVLDQLRDAWDPSRNLDAGEWEKEAERLRILRDQLNRVVDHLHMRRRNGMTAHHAIGIKVRDEMLAAGVSFSWPSADYHDETDMLKMRDAAEMLRVQSKAVRDIAETPFQLVDSGDWSPQWEGRVVESAGRLAAAALTAERAGEALLSAIGVSIPDRKMTRLDALADLAAVLIDSHRKQASYALEPDGVDRIEALEEAVDRLRNYANAQSALSCAYEPDAWRNLDGVDIDRRWQEALNAWWLKGIFLKRNILKEMRRGGAIGKPDPARDAKTLSNLRSEGTAIDRLDKLLSDFRVWEGHTTDPDSASILQDLGQRLRAAIGRLADAPAAMMELQGTLRALTSDGNDLLAPDAPIGRSAVEFKSKFGELDKACSTFQELAGRPVRELFVESDRALDTIREAAENICTRHAELRDWCGWRRRRTEAVDLDLGPLVLAIEQGDVEPDDINAVFEAAYCTWWSSAVIEEDVVLRTFSTPEHIATIEKFREIDAEFQDLTAAYVAAKLSGSLPVADDVKRGSSWGTLRRELQKKTRHKAVRQLIEEIPDVVTTLAPCLMMSPLSVAQYLPANQALFDVVIFDEASQITVWDAVGALARGKQSIIAGDPKQMPPTNFFGRADDDPDGDVDSEGDLESILDEMLGASIPQRPLNLHYRSRRESLIAFSNSRYYDNGLVTFPAPVHPDRGVRLVRPDGFYARGKARHNQGEAKAIVAEILRRLTQEDEKARTSSIGVVTFNSEQQNLIENLLDTARSNDPSIEWAFSADSCLEPIFVKNLETVQGDERDVILFSVTYGPDESDHVTMNFGPLNREGGERRLNVALTRARSEMVVFSTLSPDRIDLSRTSARAVTDLKHFLEYAERGPTALGAAVHGSVGDFDSPFESAVARALRDKGWDVHPQVGVSAFRIDLGIVHPDLPGRYLAGVECDGAMYHSSAYARERDKIRQSVLEGLGWTLFRVWSTDWWTHRAKALETLDNNLREELEADRQRRTEHEKDAVEPDDSPTLQTTEEPDADPDLVDTAHESARKLPDNTMDESGKEQSESVSIYSYVHLGEGDSPPPDADAFYSDDYRGRLQEMIAQVVATEGPIHEDVLVRRIARHHGFQRSGPQIKATVLDLAKKNHTTTKEPVGVFYWRRQPEDTPQCPARYAERDEEMRKAEYICEPEILAIADVLSLGDDPVEFARRIGVARLSKSARARFAEILGRRNSKDEVRLFP